MPRRRRRPVGQARRGRHARQPPALRWFPHNRVGRAVVVVAMLSVMTAFVTLAAVFAYHHTPGPTPALRQPTAGPSSPSSTSTRPGASDPAALEADFTRLEARLHAKMGVAASAVGDGKPVTTWGNWQEGPAWSTMKVPLVIAAYRRQNPPRVTDPMKGAIIESDNAAAESLWEQLGDPTTAADRVQQILQQAGDPTTVESRKLRPEFTAFGQTIWSLTNQARFIAGAYCNAEANPIFALMGQIDTAQRWGIGNIADTPFKGGWGPAPSGRYLVRQIGVLTTPAGKVAVAIAAEPASGSFDDGTKDLDEVARWLSDHLSALSAGGCR